MRMLTKNTLTRTIVDIQSDKCIRLEESDCIMTARPRDIQYCSSCPYNKLYTYLAIQDLPN